MPSLLDFRPEAYGLPAFQDRVAGAVPLEPPWRIKGTVVKGFGRGSKVRAATLPAPQGSGILARVASLLARLLHRAPLMTAGIVRA